MDEMEQKINSILGNPQMMAQLMSMAQALGSPKQEPERPEQAPSKPASPQAPAKTPQMPNNIDINMLQRVAGIAQRSNIDKNQQALLKALGPYLSRSRIEKLEKAMRAAKIAGLATTVLANSGNLFQQSR